MTSYLLLLISDAGCAVLDQSTDTILYEGSQDACEQFIDDVRGEF